VIVSAAGSRNRPEVSAFRSDAPDGAKLVDGHDQLHIHPRLRRGNYPADGGLITRPLQQFLVVGFTQMVTLKKMTRAGKGKGIPYLMIWQRRPLDTTQFGRAAEPDHSGEHRQRCRLAFFLRRQAAGRNRKPHHRG